MKRLTKLQQVRQLRLAEKGRRKKHKRSLKKYIAKPKRYLFGGETIEAPRVFSLTSETGKQVGEFIRTISSSVLKKNRKVRLDFRKTEQFVVTGTILLFAEIDRIISISSLKKPITIVDPRSRRAREVLKQIGIHTLTGDSCDISPVREDVVYWKSTKGKLQTGDSYGSLIEAVAERANTHHVKQIEVSGLWRGVNEAVANSVEHAYLKARFDDFKGLPDTKWWMFSQIRDGIFMLAVCDLGCGYRGTIKLSIPEAFIAMSGSTFAGKNKDALAINTAMEYGRSVTRLENRGKGSRDVLSLLEKHGSGTLHVFSNTGWVAYAQETEQAIKRYTGDIGISIGGTIVCWSLPLNKAINEHS